MSHPSDDELEVSVFGPGIGECIVVHLGHREWIIVDSCCEANGEPTALAYLNDIGVDVESEVKLIVASHWHDDHIRGLSRVFSECSSAVFSCAIALREKEFCTLVEAYGGDPMIEYKSVEELSRIFWEMEEISKKGLPRNIVWALENTTLLSKDGRYTIKALSPSHEAVKLAIKDISVFSSVRLTVE
jgi:hypothetical protein